MFTDRANIQPKNGGQRVIQGYIYMGGKSKAKDGTSLNDFE
jgi:hypothetical protein